MIVSKKIVYIVKRLHIQIRKGKKQKCQGKPHPSNKKKIIFIS